MSLFEWILSKALTSRNFEPLHFGDDIWEERLLAKRVASFSDRLGWMSWIPNGCDFAFWMYGNAYLNPHTKVIFDKKFKLKTSYQKNKVERKPAVSKLEFFFFKIGNSSWPLSIPSVLKSIFLQFQVVWRNWKRLIVFCKLISHQNSGRNDYLVGWVEETRLRVREL